MKTKNLALDFKDKNKTTLEPINLSQKSIKHLNTNWAFGSLTISYKAFA